MTPEKMISIIDMYENVLKELKVRKVRMDPEMTFGMLSTKERLEHAHFLCDGVREYAVDPEHWGKANRHFASIQMILSFCDMYTLQQLMDQNRP